MAGRVVLEVRQDVLEHTSGLPGAPRFALAPLLRFARIISARNADDSIFGSSVDDGGSDCEAAAKKTVVTKERLSLPLWEQWASQHAGLSPAEAQAHFGIFALVASSFPPPSIKTSDASANPNITATTATSTTANLSGNDPSSWHVDARRFLIHLLLLHMTSRAHRAGVDTTWPADEAPRPSPPASPSTLSSPSPSSPYSHQQQQQQQHARSPGRGYAGDDYTGKGGKGDDASGSGSYSAQTGGPDVRVIEAEAAWLRRRQEAARLGLLRVRDLLDQLLCLSAALDGANYSGDDGLTSSSNLPSSSMHSSSSTTSSSMHSSTTTTAATKDGTGINTGSGTENVPTRVGRAALDALDWVLTVPLSSSSSSSSSSVVEGDNGGYDGDYAGNSSGNCGSGNCGSGSGGGSNSYNSIGSGINCMKLSKLASSQSHARSAGYVKGSDLFERQRLRSWLRTALGDPGSLNITTNPPAHTFSLPPSLQRIDTGVGETGEAEATQAATPLALADRLPSQPFATRSSVAGFPGLVLCDRGTRVLLAGLRRRTLRWSPSALDANRSLYIDGCRGAHIYILGNVRHCTLRGLRGCMVFVGAVSGVLALENCARVDVHAACSTARVGTGCDNIVLNVSSQWPPLLLPGSTGLVVGPLATKGYPGHARDMRAAGLDIALNCWDRPVACGTAAMTPARHRLMEPHEFAMFTVPFVSVAPENSSTSGGKFETETEAETETKAETETETETKDGKVLLVTTDVPPEFCAQLEESARFAARVATVVGETAERDADTAVAFAFSVKARFRAWLAREGKMRQLQDLVHLEAADRRIAREETTTKI